MPPIHIVDRYIETLRSFGIINDERGLDYFIPYRDQVEMEWLPASHRPNYVAYAIGGQHTTKKLPLPRMIELCLRIDYPIVLLGGKEDMAAGDAIEQALGSKLIYNACGKFSLNESADLLRKSKLVITHDTGLMQIAAALKKPIITIWGSTTPSLGRTPYYGRNFLMQRAPPCDAVQVHKLWCRPCTGIGRQRCPQGHFKCMKNIPVEEIVQKAMARLRLL